MESLTKPCGGLCDGLCNGLREGSDGCADGFTDGCGEGGTEGGSDGGNEGCEVVGAIAAMPPPGGAVVPFGGLPIMLVMPPVTVATSENGRGAVAVLNTSNSAPSATRAGVEPRSAKATTNATRRSAGNAIVPAPLITRTTQNA